VTPLDADLPEVVGIAQRLAERSVHQEPAVDLSDDAVAEFQSEAEVIQWFDVCDAEHGADAKGAGRSEPGARAPVRAPSFGPVRPGERRPFAHQPKRFTGNDPLRTSSVSSVICAMCSPCWAWKCGGGVIGPVHVITIP
jgi:hypothetical protein